MLSESAFAQRTSASLPPSSSNASAIASRASLVVLLTAPLGRPLPACRRNASLLASISYLSPLAHPDRGHRLRPLGHRRGLRNAAVHRVDDARRHRLGLLAVDRRCGHCVILPRKCGGPHRPIQEINLALQRLVVKLVVVRKT